MLRNKKEEDTIPLKRRIKSFKPKKDIILSPGFEIRKTNSNQKWFGKKWKYFFKTLGKGEKIIFYLLFLAAIASIGFVAFNFYIQNTKAIPASGGIIVEGSATQPRFINPIYANSDTDRDLTELIFSGLMKYDKDMNIVPDLAAKNPEIEQDGTVYSFYLKNDLFWQDGTPLNADDVIFTIKTIQNPDLKSPYLANWVGVKAEKISDLGIKFTLQKPYAAFIENCALKIIPKHIWENVSAQNFPFQSYNLENAIGSGIYKIKEIKRSDANQQVESITLEKNNFYSGQKPYIPEIKFSFFNSQNDLVKAAKRNKITGLNADIGQLDSSKWTKDNIYMPRYFALFLNLDKNEILKNKDIRIALAEGTNKKELSKDIVDSPILPNFYGISLPSQTYGYDPEKAVSAFENAGFKDNDNDGIREKTINKELAFQFKSRLGPGSSGDEVSQLQKCLSIEQTGYFGDQTKQALISFQEKYADEILKPTGYDKGTGTVGDATRKKLNEICFGNPNQLQKLSFNLVTVDQPEMESIAKIIQSQWKEIGVNLEIEAYPLNQLEEEFIKSRNYDILLFGEVLGAIPDPFPFWHSSQKSDPGLNFSFYQNSELDKLLENNRKISDENLRKESLGKIQDMIMQDSPAIFLYSPKYSYLISNTIKGISNKKAVNISQRFSDIENWYIKTKRIWK